MVIKFLPLFTANNFEYVLIYVGPTRLRVVLIGTI